VFIHFGHTDNQPVSGIDSEQFFNSFTEGGMDNRFIVLGFTTDPRDHRLVRLIPHKDMRFRLEDYARHV
jgi:hypothetical protein